MTTGQRNQALVNLKVMKSIIETVVFCGRQNIPLRGHRDYGRLDDPQDFQTNENEGNFRALLRFRISAWDADLLEYIKTAPGNALYTIWQVQNEIINICQEEIQNKIVENVSKAKYFTLIADETTDVSKEEQLSICLRYVHEDSSHTCEVREEFFCICWDEKYDRIAALAQTLLKNLRENGLDVKYMVGQGYDSAANMSGQFNGVQAIIRSACPMALYTHCSSHCLNLVLTKACQVTPIRKTLKTAEEVIVFLSFSAGRKNYLLEAIDALQPDSQNQRLKLVCDTCWVEPHESIAIFCRLYRPIIHALNAIEMSSDYKAADKASDFKFRVRQFTFLVKLKILESVLSATYDLSKAFQARNFYLLSSFSLIDETKKVFINFQQNSLVSFNVLFKEVLVIANQNNITIPARASRSDSPTPTQEAERHHHDKTDLPLIDAVLKQFEERFSAMVEKAAKCCALVPSFLKKRKFGVTNYIVVS